MMEPIARKDASGRGRSVLFVEDDIDVQKVGRRALERMGYDVRIANSGRDALQRYGDEIDRISLVVTDIVMPEMDGPELAEEIRRMSPLMPILFITGYEPRVWRPAVERIDAAVCLLKPWTTAEFADAVAKVLAA